MAPKSWAIAHPERSAMLLTPPFRALVNAVRPLIWLLNQVSNALVRLCRVQPRDELAAVHNREQLTHLVAESERLGLINKVDSELITRSLTEPQTAVSVLLTPADAIVTVSADADLDAILARTTEADRSRLLVVDGDTVLGSIHARDVLVARTRGRAVTARDLVRPVPELSTDATVSHALEQLRRNRASLALIRAEDGRLAGLISLDDLIARLMGLQPAP
jgi:CBS domain containing-hemolysin-like protein